MSLGDGNDSFRYVPGRSSLVPVNQDGRSAAHDVIIFLRAGQARVMFDWSWLPRRASDLRTSAIPLPLVVHR